MSAMNKYRQPGYWWGIPVEDVLYLVNYKIQLIIRLSDWQ